MHSLAGRSQPQTNPCHVVWQVSVVVSVGERVEKHLHMGWFINQESTLYIFNLSAKAHQATLQPKQNFVDLQAWGHIYIYIYMGAMPKGVDAHPPKKPETLRIDPTHPSTVLFSPSEPPQPCLSRTSCTRHCSTRQTGREGRGKAAAGARGARGVETCKVRTKQPAEIWSYEVQAKLRSLTSKEEHRSERFGVFWGLASWHACFSEERTGVQKWSWKEWPKSIVTCIWMGMLQGLMVREFLSRAGSSGGFV